MSNRAVIAFGPNCPDTKGIYVHWNGGFASIEGFLDAARKLKLYTPEAVADMIKPWIGCSVCVDRIARLDCDNGDNGVYFLSDSLEIVGREYAPSVEEIDPVASASISSEVLALYRARGK